MREINISEKVENVVPEYPHQSHLATPALSLRLVSLEIPMEIQFKKKYINLYFKRKTGNQKELKQNKRKKKN